MHEREVVFFSFLVKLICRHMMNKILLVWQCIHLELKVKV